jgi:hypothetical protein
MIAPGDAADSMASRRDFMALRLPFAGSAACAVENRAHRFYPARYRSLTVAAVKREKSGVAVDNSHDIAVSSSFESKQALKNTVR